MRVLDFFSNQHEIMNTSQQSLVSAITSTRSYGATHSRMLTEIDTNVIQYKLLPTDTLQGLAIKFGVTVSQTFLNFFAFKFLNFKYNAQMCQRFFIYFITVTVKKLL